MVSVRIAPLSNRKNKSQLCLGLHCTYW